MCQLTRNSAKCHGCGDEIESKYRWDFVSCKCGAMFVDGGKDYLRRGWSGDSKSNPDDYYTDTSTYEICEDGFCRYRRDVVTDDSTI